jgi:hypothetical protein
MDEEMALFPIEQREGQSDEDYEKMIQLQRERIKKLRENPMNDFIIKKS